MLIEPATLNDARLFSLESRMHEEEEIRIKEYEFVRDLLKKLIYSLEKTGISAADMNPSLQPNKSSEMFQVPGQSPVQNRTSQSKSQTPMLPNLLNNISLQNSIKEINIMGKNNQSVNESLLSAGKSTNQN